MTRAHELCLEDVTLSYGDAPVVESADMAIPPGRVTAIVGANACGKSTLLRAMSRLLTPDTGRVALDGHDLHRLPTRQVARTVGLLPQSQHCPEGIVVADLVSRGRHPHRRAWSRWSGEDHRAVTSALEATGTTELADRVVDELSGGQRQRVWIAMVLAQESEVLLLDEPTTFLDLAHQVEVLDLLTDLNRRQGTTIAMVLHDVNLAARYADHLIAVAGGRVHAAGDAAEVVTSAMVEAVFGLTSRIIEDPVSRTPMVVPVGRHHAGQP